MKSTVFNVQNPKSTAQIPSLQIIDTPPPPFQYFVFNANELAQIHVNSQICKMKNSCNFVNETSETT